MVANVVELDGEMRSTVMKDDVHCLAAAVVFDFVATSPSRGHGFMPSGLGVAGLPAGLVWLVRSMCASTTLVIAQGTGVVHFSELGSGVLQGSPLSGALFVLSMDSVVVVALGAVVPLGAGLVQACADDAGAVLVGIARLLPLAAGFAEAEEAAGLALNRRKGHVGPLIGAASPRVCRRARRAVATAVP